MGGGVLSTGSCEWVLVRVIWASAIRISAIMLAHVSNRQVTESRVIEVSAKKLFDLLADPSRHPELDGSGTVKAARGTAQRLKLGSKFSMDMSFGVPYRIFNTVVEFEENKLIAWRHFNGHRWRWELKEISDGKTEVAETFDYSTALFPPGLEWLGFPEKNRKGITRTLDNLEQRFGGDKK